MRNVQILLPWFLGAFIIFFFIEKIPEKKQQKETINNNLIGVDRFACRPVHTSPQSFEQD